MTAKTRLANALAILFPSASKESAKAAAVEAFRPVHRTLVGFMAAAGLVLFANTTAICTSFKAEAMTALHALGTTVTRGATTADVIKAALYSSAGSIGAATTAYSATNEASGSGYTAGGITVTNATAPTTSGTTAFWTPSAALAFGTVTLTAVDAVLIYNSTQSNRAISTHNFGSQTVTAATFTLNMPTNDASNALVRIA